MSVREGARLEGPDPLARTVLLQVVQRGGGSQQQLQRIHRRLGKVRHGAVTGLQANRGSEIRRPVGFERYADPICQANRTVL